MYDRQRYDEVYARLRAAPASLTDEDLAALAEVDPAIMHRARAVKAAVANGPDPAMPTKGWISVPVFNGFLDEIFFPIMKNVVARADRLAQRVTELEARATVQYGGVFKHGTTYSEGTLVTRSGGLWLALRPTSVVPGTDAAAWRLIVKSGGA